MRSKSFEGMVCPIAGVMSAIGDRWGMIVLRDLVLGLHRYDDFRRSSGITHATLSDRLKHLESNDLIERRPYQDHPERWEYFLTRRGRRVASILPVIAQIGDELGMAGSSTSPMAFVHRETGADVHWTFVDKASGAHLGLEDLAVREGPGADELVRWRLAHAKQRQKGSAGARSESTKSGRTSK